MELINVTNQTQIASRVQIADTFWRRLVGLLDREKMAPGEALVIRPCQGVHTCFMRFPIDVVFLDDTNRIVHLITGMPPWRFSPVVREARAVVELPAGTIEQLDLRKGHVLRLLGRII